MDCNEFRKKITDGADFDKELIEHKGSCKDCQEWLNNELHTAPNGLSKEDWDKAVSKCLDKNNKDTTNTQNTKDEKEEDTKEPENEKSFLDYYLSGLKYGIVFGLAIVVGFAIVQNQNEAKQQSISNQTNLASDTANISSEAPTLPIATDSELIQLPTK